MKKSEIIFSIVVILLFLGSIISYGVVASNRRSEENNNFYDQNSVDQNQPAQVYYAIIDSNILEVYPQLIFISNTNEFDKEIIDGDLRIIDGVKKVTSNFTQLQDGNISFMANIIYDAAKKESIIENISKLNYLNNLEFYQYAKFSLSSDKINLINDSNQSLEYEFSEGAVEGIANVDSMQGDSVTGQFQVVFSGSTPVQYMFLELKNNSSAPQVIFSNISLPVSYWKPQIKITAEGSLDIIFDENNIKDLFNDDNVFVNISTVGNLEYSFSSDVNIDNLNLALNTIKDENENVFDNFSIDANENILVISFSENIDVTDYNFLKNKLQEIGLTSLMVSSEPIKVYEIIIPIEDFSESDIDTKLKENNLVLKSIQQQAIFNVSELTIENKKYFYDENEMDVWVNVDDVNEELISLQVQAYVSRNNILFMSLSQNK